MKKQIDTYPWGSEEIVWGHNTNQLYTFKLLRPKIGKAGCLSLQYHHKKCETWLGVQGIGWGLIISPNNLVRTVLIHPGQYITHLPYTIHRLMGVTKDFVLAEASTPDAYAADKTAIKDVVRLHCVHGRACDESPDRFKKAVKLSIELTEEAIERINQGLLPEEKIIQIS